MLVPELIGLPLCVDVNSCAFFPAAIANGLPLNGYALFLITVRNCRIDGDAKSWRYRGLGVARGEYGLAIECTGDDGFCRWKEAMVAL